MSLTAQRHGFRAAVVSELLLAPNTASGLALGGIRCAYSAKAVLGAVVEERSDSIAALEESPRRVSAALVAEVDEGAARRRARIQRCTWCCVGRGDLSRQPNSTRADANPRPSGVLHR